MYSYYHYEDDQDELTEREQKLVLLRRKAEKNRKLLYLFKVSTVVLAVSLASSIALSLLT